MEIKIGQNKPHYAKQNVFKNLATETGFYILTFVILLKHKW